MARAIVVKKASRTATGKPVAGPVGKTKPKARKHSKPSSRLREEALSPANVGKWLRNARRRTARSHSA